MKKKSEEKENSERWLLTYSDLITLLMVLFVILYASSNVDSTKYKQIAQSFKTAFNINESGSSSILDGSGDSEVDSSNDSNNGDSSNDATQTPESNQNTEGTEENKLEKVQSEINNLLNQAGLANKYTTKIEERGLVISISDNIFFDIGKAEVKNQFKSDLIGIATVLNKTDNCVRVEGNTDNVAINNSEFSSNWQLSSIRAANVVQILIGDGRISPDRLSAVGYGEYRPIADNNTEQGRILNRRVDIVILNDKYVQSESNK